MKRAGEAEGAEEAGSWGAQRNYILSTVEAIKNAATIWIGADFVAGYGWGTCKPLDTLELLGVA